MKSGRERHQRLRSFDHNFNFSVDKEDGIQLTERQVQLRQQRLDSISTSTAATKSTRREQSLAAKPFETRSNKTSQKHTEPQSMKLEREKPSGGPRSAASTTLYRSQKQREDQKALLRKVLASKAAANNAPSARSTASTPAKSPYSRDDRRAFLKRVVAERNANASDDSPESGARSSISTNATSNNGVDQKALLRQVLAKTKAKKLQQHTDSTTNVKTDRGEVSSAAVRGETAQTTSRGETQKAAAASKESYLLTRCQKKHDFAKERKTPSVEKNQQQPSFVLEKRALSRKASESSRGVADEKPAVDIPTHMLQETTKSNDIDDDRIRDRSKRKPISGSTSARRKKKGKESSEPLIQASVGNYDMNDITPEIDHRQDPPQSVITVDGEQKVNDKSSRQNMIYSVDTPDWALPVENQEDEEGFTEFMDSLKKEVASDHIELWRSFQSLFYGKSAVPHSALEKQKRIRFNDKTKESLATMNLYIKSSSAVECVTETQLVNDKKVAREMRKEFASRRQESNGASRESPQCASKTSKDKQSVTTKEYLEKARKRLAERKSTARRKASYGRLGSSPSIRMNMDSLPHHDPPNDSQTESMVPDWPQPDESIDRKNLPDNDGEKERREQHEKRKSWLAMHRAKNSKPTESDTNDDGSDKENEAKPSWPTLRTSNEPAVRQVHIEEKVESSPAQSKRPMPWLVALQERKARMARQAEIHSMEESNGKECESHEDDRKKSITFVQIAKANQQRSTLSITSGDSEDMSIARQRSLLDDDTDEENEICDTPKSVGSLSGRKRRQDASFPFEASVETSVPVENSVSLWSAVKLRTASHQYQKKEDAQQYNGFLSGTKLRDLSHRGGAQSECGVPWSTIKLRPVVSKDEHEEKSPAQKEEPLPFRQMLRRVPSAAIRNRTVPTGVRIDDDSEGAPVVPPVTSWEQPSPNTDLTKEDSGLKVGDEIDLHNLPNHLFEEQEPSFVMLLQRTPGMPKTDAASVIVGKRVLMTVRSHDNNNLSRITWHESRGCIQSLTLDMAENRADLSLSSNRAKSLTFRNTEDCLNFANAFYLTKTLEQTKKKTRQESAEIIVPSEDEESEKLQELEQSPSKKLSKEEEKLLETYRQIRQTKAPEEAMRQTMANEAGDDVKPIDSELSEEEEKVASRFRRMLKFSIPPEAVRHEMAKEQVSDMIVNAVLGGAESNEGKSSAVEKSTSCLSVENEKFASKYRKMLRMGVPADGVRHKMTKDEVASEVIASVLGSETTFDGDKEEKPATELSEDEEKIASTYRKMLKMMVPSDAVRHRMMKDKIDPKIVAAILEDNSSSPEEPKGAPTSILSGEEEKIASTYRTMLKMRVPADAVRHRMTKDKVDNKIIAAILCDDPSTFQESKGDSAAILSGEEEEIASTYRKMLKMMVPADAVRHRMTKDKVDRKIITAVLGDDPTALKKTKGDSEAILSGEEEKIASSYRKMLKMMVPIEAVRHKMVKEKVDPKVIAAVLGPDTSKQLPNVLTEDEEKVAMTYRKMLKMNVPREAVRHKMVCDGVKDKIVSIVLCDKPSATPLSSKAAVKGSKLVALHWTPLSGKELDNTVWRASKKRKVNADGSDVSKLVELFQKKSNPRAGKAASTKSTSANGSGDEMAKLIDLNRANNVAISLKAFKEFTHKELAETITNLDPQRIIQGERCQFVKDLLPNASEMKDVKAYKGPEKKLVPAELFFRELINVPRIEVKVCVMQTMDTFTENARELSSRFQILATVCNQVMESEKLQDVLEMVLQVGNIMNEGTRTGGAAGFKFDSLLKLTQTKSADGKTTVLDYLVMIFMAKNSRETLQLTAEFPEVQTAARMALNDMTADVRTMGGALTQCKTELVNMKKDGSKGPVTRSMSKRFGGIAYGSKSPTAADPRNALLAAIKAKGSKEEPPKSFEKRDQFLSAAQEQKPNEKREQQTSVGEILNAITTCGQMDDVYNSDDEEARKAASSPRSKMLQSIKANSVRKVKAAVNETQKQVEVESKSGTHEEGVQRLESFVEEATSILSELEGNRDEAIKSCKELSKYCGEGGGERAAISLIGILSQFAINLDNAVQKYDAMEEARLRREAAMKKRESLEQSKKASAQKGETKQPSKELRSPTLNRTSTENKGPSLVLIVNDLLHSASDQAKEDFVKGVVYEKTSDARLRTIYERERKSLGGVLMPQQEGRESILSAIKKRRKHDED